MENLNLKINYDDFIWGTGIVLIGNNAVGMPHAVYSEKVLRQTSRTNVL